MADKRDGSGMTCFPLFSWQQGRGVVWQTMPKLPVSSSKRARTPRTKTKSQPSPAYATHGGYVFGTKPGTYIVTLDDRQWGQSRNLRCYFSTDDNLKFYLSVFSNNDYQPFNGGPNFKTEAAIGDGFEISVGRSKAGAATFLTAKPLHVVLDGDF